MAADEDEHDRIRVTIAGRELPVEDIQARVNAALIVGAIIVAAWLALIWTPCGGW